MHSLFVFSQGLFLLQTYWRSVSEFTHRLRRFTQDSGQRFSSQFFTTHNLLVKNEAKKSQPSELGEKEMNPILLRVRKKILGSFIVEHRSTVFRIERPEVRQVWGNFRSEVRAFGRALGAILERLITRISKVYPDLRQLGNEVNERSPSYRQSLSRFTPVEIALKKALRQRAFQGGVVEEKNLVRGCVTPPWNDLKLSDISFINPLRYAPIAGATPGLIQAMMLHSTKSSLRGDSV